MSKTKHTPGPWSVHPVHARSFVVVGNPTLTCGPLAEVPLPQTNLGFPEVRASERDANARLIAAAPELLEALEFIRQYFEAGNSCSQSALFGDGDETTIGQAVEVAIKKAKGE